ncbi:hypothetical protein BpHYR1_028974 [Brachionus plicatilis]|uniref:SH3 domain-containing protein n=1 Tax=Brachionus plicatilis TaxID=10195 RepID=A0A3M7RUA8_BRAPC|nr:hypothetical protein BpHYR1_028974 [Brachionus plicatilis]
MTRKLEFVMDGEPESDETQATAKPQEPKVITNFDELRNLKPRCRLPIDIACEQDNLSQPSSSMGKKYFSFLQTNKNFVNKITESVWSATSSGYSSTSSSPSTSPSYQQDLFIIENDTPTNSLKSPLKQNENSKPKIKSKGRHSIDSCQSRPVKILTVLFDYESRGKEILGNKVVFSVKKGQLVKVLRDYDKDFHLVAKCTDNSIGFLPKDYTVDLVEVKNKVLKNSFVIAQNDNYLTRPRVSLGSKKKPSRNYENIY